MKVPGIWTAVGLVIVSTIVTGELGTVTTGGSFTRWIVRAWSAGWPAFDPPWPLSSTNSTVSKWTGSGVGFKYWMCEIRSATIVGVAFAVNE